ncbi:MAG: TonB-dependent receptor plug domain-containing protein [Nitrospiria bacterium]
MKQTIFVSIYVNLIFAVLVQQPVYGEEVGQDEQKMETFAFVDKNGYYQDIALLKSEYFVYSASKRIESIKIAPTPVTVITSNQISLLSTLYLPEIIRLFPGMDVSRMSRTEYSVSIRGLNTNSVLKPREVLVLEDGRTVFDDFSGNVDWENLDVFPQDIGKIEIIRGAGSAIYGPNAARGVINLITKPAEALPAFESDTSMSAYNGFRQRIAGGYNMNNYSLKITGGFDQADLLNNTDPNSAAYNGPYYDQLGAKTWRLNSVLGKTFNDDSKLRFNVGTNTGKLIQTTASGVFVDNEQTTDHVMAEYDHPEALIRAFWNYKQLTMFDPATYNPAGSRTEQMYDFEINKKTIRFGKNQITYGLSTRLVNVSADTIQGTASQWTEGLFLDEQYNVSEKFLLRAAARLDHHDLAGYQVSPRVGVSYRLNDENVLKASINQGYRNPTLSDNFLNLQIFDPFGNLIATLYGNKELKPEESIWYEAGWIGTFHNLTLQADGFFVATENFIYTQHINATDGMYFNSSNRVEGRGGELSASYHLTPNVQILGNGSYNYYRQGDLRIESVPVYKTNVGVLVSDIQNFSGAVTFNYTDKTGWFNDPGSEIPSYYSLNMFLNCKISKNMLVQLDGINITNNYHRENPIGELFGSEITGTIKFIL